MPAEVPPKQGLHAVEVLILCMHRRLEGSLAAAQAPLRTDVLLCVLLMAVPGQVRCWTILQGTLAPQAAGVIHTDFERGFIKAEVVAFDDFKR